MLKDDLKCVLIGRDVGIYTDLARLVRKIDSTSRFKQVELKESTIINVLKKVRGPSLIFISDEVPFSLELLSDLTWQYNPDSIVVIVTNKARTVTIKELFNNTQFSRINLNENRSHSVSILQFLIQSTKEKTEFRRCKNLLGISEKRCQWLVDSSREAIAFISRDIHWYANPSYIELFGVSSIQELRAITIKDIIVADEHLLFDGFQQNQKKSWDINRSLILSMKKQNGSTFRATVCLIPSVFKGRKCHQLWVREINALETSNDSRATDANTTKDDELAQTKTNKTSSQDEHPFSSLVNKSSELLTADSKNTDDPQIENLKTTINNSQNKKYDQKSLLRGVIKRKEARVVVTSLNSLKNKKSVKHRMVSLKVASAQKKGVDGLLMKLPETYNDSIHAVFWDKVKLSRVLQILIKKDKIAANLFIQISEASVLDESFIEWLLPGLNRLGSKSQNLNFLIAANVNESDYKQTLIFIEKLRLAGCQITLNSFSVTKNSLILLKHARPNYVRLSLPWVREIQGNEYKEIKLSNAVIQLERNNIKVIAPCGFSKDIRKLFILSGASFCQERVKKTA